MDRIKVTVLHDDGQTDEVVLRPVSLVAAERHFKGKVPPMEGTLWAVHHQLRVPEAFGTWLEHVDGVEESIADPTPAAASAPSPTSQ